MNRTLALLLFLSLALCGPAYGRRHAMLKIRLSDDSRLAVNLDGRYISRETRMLTLDGLRPGLHRLEVYRTDHPRRRPFRIFTGTVRLKRGMVHVAVVDVDDRVLRMRSRPRDEQDDRVPAESPGRDSRGSTERNGVDDIYERSERADPPVEEGFGSFPRGRNNSNSAERSPARMLPRTEFDNLKDRVNNSTTDTDKERVMKEELREKQLTTAEVRSMLSWLAFESTRLEFAKWAYTRVTDPERYGTLEDAFDFSSSREEFRKAIGER